MKRIWKRIAYNCGGNGLAWFVVITATLYALLLVFVLSLNTGYIGHFGR